MSSSDDVAHLRSKLILASTGSFSKASTMTQALEHVIDVISRQTSARSEADVSGTLPWLRRRTELMAQLNKGTVVQLVRNCGYQSAERDDVIIQQGEVGERYG
ncbi:hypothetical protein V1264_014705 [Littorina saxatilis]|uniref:Uncharacterized protein n=2 Tax=Littorina saxatilis TaxID=31220 RepID=A0AAN9BSN0_9CAEN